MLTTHDGGERAQDRRGIVRRDEGVPPTAAAWAPSGRILVVLVNNRRDWERLQREGWYRIPLARAPAHLHADYLAFYQTKAFGAEGQRIAYVAPVRGYTIVPREELLPDEPHHPRAHDLYVRIALGPLYKLPHPIPSRRWHRVLFIATTWRSLLLATDVSELARLAAWEDASWLSIGGPATPQQARLTDSRPGERHRG